MIIGEGNKMGNNIVNNYCSTMTSIIADTIKNYERNVAEIKRIEEELNDLNHEIELSSPKDLYKGYLMYKAIRELRIERRRCKEENELLADMYDYFNGQQGQAFKSKMQSIQGTSVKLQATQEARTYQPRQRNDLTITDKHSTATKPFQEMLDDFNKNKAYMKNGKLRR